jgi:hypothetical protein
VTFEDIIQPYLDQFGEPDQTFEHLLADGLYRQYFWYQVDVIAEFAAPTDDTVSGWELSFAICLDPLRFIKNE